MGFSRVRAGRLALALAGAAAVASTFGPRTGEPARTLVPPTNLGPTGAPTFCLAPPAPERRDPPPYPEFAPPLRDIRLTPAEARGLGAPPDTSRVLFLLAAFKDVAFDSAGIDTAGIGAFDPDTLLAGFFRKQIRYVREFYSDVSYGRKVLDAVVPDFVVTLPFNMAYYGNDDLFSERGTKLIWDAVRGADDAVDFALYDGLAIIHSAAGQESDILNNSKTQIWSAFFPQALVSFVMTDSLGYDVPGIPTNDLTSAGDTVYVEAAALLPETESQDGFNFGLMGVYTHELGHVIAGWPDLYDTTPEDPSQGIGAFCLMAAGTWNANGFVPAEPSAWCRVYAGWIDPVRVDAQPGAGETVRLQPVETDAPNPADTLVVQIPIAADEYFLVEYRQPDPNDNRRFDWVRAGPDSLFSFWTDSFEGAEFDYYLPNEIPASPMFLYREAAGLYVWHVDESLVTFGFPFNRVNSDPHHMGVDLEEADGQQDMEYDIYTLLSFGSPDDAFRAGNATAFTPWTTPSTATSFGAPSGIMITDVSAPDETMTFRLRLAGDGDGPLDAAFAAGWPVELPASTLDTAPLAADVDGDGEPEFVVVDDAGTVFVFELDGSVVSDAVLRVSSPPACAPLAGDVLGDDGTEIVVPALDGTVHVFGVVGGALASLATVPGDSLDGGGGAVLADVLPDDYLELVMGFRNVDADTTEPQGRLQIVSLDDGTEATRTFDERPSGSPVVPVVDGVPVVVQALAEGGLQCIHHDPAQDGWWRRVASTDVRFGSPAAGDVDRSGGVSVVVHGDDGGVYTFSLSVETDMPQVTARTGWPVAVGGVPRSGVSLSDVDGDGYSEILAVGTSGAVHVLNHNGVPVSGWPKRSDVPEDTFFDFTTPHPAPLAVDVTGDGTLDVVVVFADGRVVGLSGRGGAFVPLRGWPLQIAPGSVPVVGDFDADGWTDVFALQSARNAEDELLWSRAARWTLANAFTSRADAWSMLGRDAARNAVAATSADGPATGGALVAELYWQPNPGRADGTWLHYRLGGAWTAFASPCTTLRVPSSGSWTARRSPASTTSSGGTERRTAAPSCRRDSTCTASRSRVRGAPNRPSARSR